MVKAGSDYLNCEPRTLEQAMAPRRIIIEPDDAGGFLAFRLGDSFWRNPEGRGTTQAAAWADLLRKERENNDG